MRPSLDRDPLSLPICLEFGPVLEVLAEAGCVGERLNELLVQFNRGQQGCGDQAGVGCRGKVADIDLCRAKRAHYRKGSCSGNCTLWTREHGGEAHGSRLGVELPNGARYAPGRGLAVPGATCRLCAFGRRPGCCISAPTSWWR